jgi:hypothetical protein
MESAPSTNEFTTEDEKSERKKAKRIGSGEAAAAKPLQEAKPADERAERGLLRRLISNEADSKSRPEADEALPLDALSPAEEQMVAHELVRADQAAAAEAVNPEASASEATEAVDRFRARIIEADQTPDQAFADTLEELGAEPLPANPETPEGGEMPAEAAEPAFQPREFNGNTIELQRSDQAPQSSEAPDFLQTGNEPAAAEQGTGNNEPPATPQRRRIFPARADSAFGLPGPDVRLDYDRSDVDGAALIGGMVSYLVGRRRGRIKAEKRLLPVQKKLEKQVKGLRRDLQEKETVIRQTAAERARQQLVEAYPGRRPVSPPSEKAEAKPATKRPEYIQSAVDRQPEKMQIGQILITAAETLPALAAERGETRQLAKAKAAESRPAERFRPAAERASSIPLAKHVETMSRQDLLELSSKIVVESTSLRQVYESRQIGEKALRRIVGEHLGGGDVQKVLRNELLQHEIDFERDPIMRDRAHSNTPDGGGKTLHTLLQRADATIGNQETEELAVLKARAAYQLKEKANQERQHRLVNLSLASTIVVLLAIVIVLMLSR